MRLSHSIGSAAANVGIVQAGTLDELRARPATDFVRGLVADLTWTEFQRDDALRHLRAGPPHR